MRYARWTLLPAALALAACNEQTERIAGSERNAYVASAAVQEQTGLSRLPIPAERGALTAALRRHYPREFIGKRPQTAVLVDISVDERGRVRDVAVVDRPPGAPAMLRAVLTDYDPRTGKDVAREFTTVYDAAFGPAARKAISEVRFLPAIREGKPVPFTLRMTVQFTSP